MTTHHGRKRTEQGRRLPVHACVPHDSMMAVPTLQDWQTKDKGNRACRKVTMPIVYAKQRVSAMVYYEAAGHCSFWCLIKSGAAATNPGTSGSLKDGRAWP